MKSNRGTFADLLKQIQQEEEKKHIEPEERETLTVVKPVKGPYKLADDQQDHLRRLLKITKYSPVCRDSSETGLGKTFVFFSLAKELGVPLFVISPSSITENILSKNRAYTNTPEISMIRSYAEIMRGEDGFLESYKNPDNPKALRDYEIGDDFREMVEEGVLLVCDEYHFAKNMSNRAKAVGTLIKYIVDQYVEYREKVDAYRAGEIDTEPKKFRSRVLVCSATQMDKEKQALGFLINLGYVNGKLIAGSKENLDTTNYMKLLEEIKVLAKGFSKTKEIRQVERELGIKLYDKNLRPIRPKPGSREVAIVDSIMYSLTKKVLFDLITSEMKSFIPRLTFNGFFDFDRAEDDRTYKLALLYLSGQAPEETLNRLQEMNKGLILSQLACVYTSVKFLKDVLKKDPSSKVCFSSRFSEKVLPYAKKLFEADNELGPGYTCLVLTGASANTPAKKEDIVRLYQADNGKYRVLLISVQLGVGIDLHDVSPTGRPRTSIVLRDFSPIDTHQMAGRFFRRGMYTFGNCYLFNSIKYGSSYNQISNLLAKKSTVLKSVTKEQLKLGLKRSFPGYYPRCFMDGTTVDLDGNNQKILFLDEEYLASKNDAKHGGRRVGDRDLISLYVRNKPLPFVDPPKNFLPVETKDDFPVAYRAVDEKFEGLSGIFWLNEKTKKGMSSNYEPNVGVMPKNKYNPATIDIIAQEFSDIIEERKREQDAKKKKTRTTRRLDEDEDEGRPEEDDEIDVDLGSDEEILDLQDIEDEEDIDLGEGENESGEGETLNSGSLEESSEESSSEEDEDPSDYSSGEESSESAEDSE
jgi:hypothetical protein